MFLSSKCSSWLDLSACTDKTLSRSFSSLGDLFGIDIITFLSLLCLHGCSRCNLDIISLAHLWLCHPWSCCIWLKRGRGPPSELASVSSRQEVCPRKVCVFAEWGDLSRIIYSFVLPLPGLPWLQVFWYQKGWLLYWWQYMFALSLTWQAICAPGHM